MYVIIEKEASFLCEKKYFN